ncbi:helix-turn-helix transcriptional regulator [Halarchaeum sp. P4]|uniref:helix-turn-helix transcriptional regulator n=1 Tax=Halarchaeum sp. P4 TaxID=3421639 RepID=UPI003EBB5961
MSGKEPDPHGTISAVAERYDLLAALLDGSPTRRELAADLGVSKSTVYRALTELADNGVLTENGSRYRPTLYGWLVFRRYQRLLETVGQYRPSGFLASAVADSPIDPTLLLDADVDVPDRNAPDRLLETIRDVVTDATRLRGFSPVVRDDFVTMFADDTAPDFEAELVLERPALQALRDDYAADGRLADADDAVSLRHVDTTLPFGLLAVEEPTPAVLVVVFGPTGAVQGIVRTCSEDAYTWATETYEEYYAASAPASLHDDR